MEDVNKVIKMIEQERQVSVGGLQPDADLVLLKRQMECLYLQGLSPCADHGWPGIWTGWESEPYLPIQQDLGTCDDTLASHDCLSRPDLWVCSFCYVYGALDSMSVS
jgi:hypothetical protein